VWLWQQPAQTTAAPSAATAEEPQQRLAGHLTYGQTNHKHKPPFATRASCCAIGVQGRQTGLQANIHSVADGSLSTGSVSDGVQLCFPSCSTLRSNNCRKAMTQPLYLP
jgi:hypothetical protein